MRDDIFEDDIFEEDIFEEDVFNEEAVVSPAKTKEDEETEYVISLLKQGVSWIEDAIRSIDKVIDINNKFTEEVTGIRTQTLNQIKDVYDKFLLDLLLDNNTNELIEIVKHTLNTNDQVATDYVNQQRMTLLENIDKNRKKKITRESVSI